MNKANTIKHIADQTGLSSEEVDKVIQTFFVVVMDQVKSGNHVALNTIGRFVAKDRESRQVRQFGSCEIIEIPQSRTVQFKPSKYFLNRLQEEQKSG